MSYLRDIKIVKQYSDLLNCGPISEEVNKKILNDLEHKLRLVI